MRALHWFRNDLRLADNPALAEAARNESVLPVFVLDQRLLRGERASPARNRFLLDCLRRLADDLERRACPLVVVRGDPLREIPRLARERRIDLVTWNRDVTPFAQRRDRVVADRLESSGVQVRTCKDRVVFEAHEIRKKDGTPYSVYTPYRNAWWSRFQEEEIGAGGAARLPVGEPVALTALPDPDSWGRCVAEGLPTGGERAAQRRLRSFLRGAVSAYSDQRHFPCVDGTSRLSPHLRLGTISARQCFAAALEAAAEDPGRAEGVRRWLDELIWREFYHAILSDHPHVLWRAFRRPFDRIVWEDDPKGFEAWCAGRTGFPLVDAAMRQLTRSGWMHNRSRMVVASFLTKDLGIDWREGERFFMQHLVDGDPANNNGGWQWTASTGTDAQPYFRIFNPVEQSKRWDPEGAYIRRWLPELRGVAAPAIHEPWRQPGAAADYPAPILDHRERRARALERFQAAQEAEA